MLEKQVTFITNNHDVDIYDVDLWKYSNQCAEDKILRLEVRAPNPCIVGN